MAAWIKGHFAHKMADIKEMMRHGSSGQLKEDEDGDYTITFTPKDSAAEEVNEEDNANEEMGDEGND